MITKTKRIIAISTVAASLTLGAGMFFASNRVEALRSKATNDYSIVFDSNCALQSTSSGNEFAYTNSSLGNKYGAIVVDTTGEHSSDDLFVLKGSSNFIRFSFGDISSDGNFSEANFNGRIQSVNIEVMYTASNDYTLYTRVYFSSSTTFDTSSSSARKSITTPKNNYSVLSFDLSSIENCNYIEIGVSNGFANYHIKSLTINYSC